MRFTTSNRPARPIRRIVSAAAICLALVGIGLAGAGSANATTSAGQPSASTAMPLRAACSTPIWYSLYQVHADDPIQTGWGVDGYGWLRMDENICGATTHTEVETKVCGTFGCNYESWASGGWVNAYAGYTYTSATMDCRDGTNRYKTTQHANIPTAGGGVYDIAHSANQIEFAC